MKALSQGKNKEVIESMIKHLIQSTKGTQFDEHMDETAIKDIAEVVTVDKDLFSPEDSAMLGQSHAI